MQIDPTIRNYQSHLTNLSDAISSNGVIFYLDTNTLMWLIEIAPSARAEFIAWCRSIDKGEVKVPVWAAHEFHHHMGRKSVMSKINDRLSVLELNLKDLRTLAVARADDSTCRAAGFSSREIVVNEAAAMVNKFKGFNKALKLEISIFLSATNEVVEFMNERMLESDIDQIGRSINNHASFRYGHRIPPGFQDRAKNDNGYGDLIIWEEILLDLITRPKSDFDFHAVFISRDEKNDWTTSSPRIERGDGSLTGINKKMALDVSKPHPMLVHELEKRIGRCQFDIVHPHFLAVVLNWSANRDDQDNAISSWLAVSYNPGDLLHLEDRKVAGVPTQLLEKSGESFEASLKSVINSLMLEEMQDFATLDVIQQGTLLASILNPSVDPFRIGKTLGVVASHTPAIRERIFDILEKITVQIDDIAANKVLLAMLVHVFYESEKLPRRFPILEIGSVLLRLEKDKRYQFAFDHVCKFLTTSDVKLPYIPGDKNQEVKVYLDVAKSHKGSPRRIRDLRIGSLPIITDGDGYTGSRSLSSLLRRNSSEGCTTTELKHMIILEFLIPEDQLQNMDEMKNLTWSEDTQVSRLDTETETGIGSPNDAEE